MCVSMGAWADVITFVPGTDVSDGTSITKNGITLTATTFNNSEYYQAYSGTPLKVTSTAENIIKVEITCYASGTSKYGPSLFYVPTTGTGNYSYSGKVGTWTGNVASLSLSTTGQVRMTEVVVTTGASTPATPYTVTFYDDKSSVTEASAGAGVTLPSRSQVGDYTFSGWCEQEIEETTTKPTIIKAGTYKPTKDITLYPVYQKSEGDAGSSATASATSRLSASTTAQTLEAGKPITYKVSSANTYSDPLRVYKGNTLTFAGATITKIVLTGEDSNSPATNLILAGNKKGSISTSGNSVIWEGEETTVVFNASSGQARVSSIEVTYTTGSSQVTYYTSNPSGVTKTLQSDLSISGTYPTSFYVGDEFSSEGIVVKANYSDEGQVDVTSKVSFKGYDMNVAGNYEVTVEYTEKDVTASAKYNITVNEIPTYSVTIVEPENGSIKVMYNDLLVLTGDKFMAGEELIITATADNGYSFKNIKVTDNSDHEFIVNPKTWKMGASDITITANFEKIPVYTINWSVNGKIIQSDEILKGNPVVAPSVTVPAGTTKQFTGNWVTTPTVDADATPAYVTLSIATEDKTYYAVFADVEEGSGETEYSLDNEAIKNAYVANVTTSYGTEEKTIGDWTGKCIINLQDSKYFAQINKNTNNYYLSSPTYEYSISKVTINTTGGTASTKTAAGRKFYLCADNKTAQPTEGTYGEGAIAEDNGSVTINTTGDPTQFYLYTDGTARIASIVVTCGSAASYSDFTTLLSADVTISKYGYATFVAPCDLDFAGSVVTAYAVTPDLANSQVNLTPVEKVPAGKAIVVKGDQGTYTIPTIEAAIDFETALEASTTEVIATDADADTYYYLGVVNEEPVFRPLAVGGKLAVGKCFFTVAKSAGAKNLKMAIIDDETTGISNVNVNAARSNAIYNLAGQRVNASTKGIIIVNGKKMLNK